MRHTRKKGCKSKCSRHRSSSRSIKRSIKRSRHRSSKRSSKHHSYTGGEPAALPFKSFGFPLGANSPREAALKIAQANDENLYLMNKQSGGADVIEVPQFSPIGGIQTAYSTTDLSKLGNEVNVNVSNDAKNDCFATNTCSSKAGGKRRR